MTNITITRSLRLLFLCSWSCLHGTWRPLESCYIQRKQACISIDQYIMVIIFNITVSLSLCSIWPLSPLTVARLSLNICGAAITRGASRSQGAAGSAQQVATAPSMGQQQPAIYRHYIVRQTAWIFHEHSSQLLFFFKKRLLTNYVETRVTYVYILFTFPFFLIMLQGNIDI